MDYSKHLNNNVPQTEPLWDKRQVQNNAGGYVFNTEKHIQFRRFLILGTQDGSYYVGEKELTVENAKNIINYIKSDGLAAVAQIVDVSGSGLAPKNDPAIFALALACTYGDEDTRLEAYEKVSSVCRTGTHLFTFCQYVNNLKGWSRGLRKAVANWYTSKTIDNLSYQLIKYRQRNGWTHRDVLRLCHAKAKSESQNDVFKWVVGKSQLDGIEGRSIINLYENIRNSPNNLELALSAVKEHNLPREALPTELLNNKDVWQTMLPKMPLTAMLRNLGKMSSLGMFESNFDANILTVVNKLNGEAIRASKVHPMSIFLALKTYSQGHGNRGKLFWPVNQKIVDSLNDAFYLAFNNVTPTGKNIVVGLDVSGSMCSQMVAGTSISSAEAAAAMTLVLLNTEPNVQIVGFSDKLENLNIGKRTSLNEILGKFKGGGTDCGIPFAYAINKKLNVDTFVLFSDSETWAGSNHVCKLIDYYRKNINKDAKVVGVGMAANKFQLTEPGDLKSINVAGCDSSVPQLINEFIKESV